ncbi:MAG: hypothetical protein ACRDRI_17645 [Pseudonocardiaceae bacterium]
MTKFVPILPDDAPLIHIGPGARGMMTDEFARNRLAFSLVQDLERDGVLAPGAWKRSRPLFVRAGTADDTDYLITVVRKPGSTPNNPPLIHVCVIREVPDRIGSYDLTTLLQVMAPEVFEDGATISFFTGDSGWDDPRELAMIMIALHHREYLSDGYDIRIVDGRDQDGIHCALAKIFAKIPKRVYPDYPSDSSPDSGKAKTAMVSPWRRLWRRITAVRQPDSTPIPGWENHVARMMANHVRHMVSQIPAAAVGECWSGLGNDEMVTATAELLHQGLLEARRTHDLATRTCAIAKYSVAATVVPPSNIGEARDRFAGGYLAYLKELVERFDHTVGSQSRLRRNFVHWIMSFDGAAVALHATVLPAGDTERVMFAVDLLAPAERQELGL